MKAKKKGDQWYVQVYFGMDEDGKKIQRWYHGFDKKAVLAEAAAAKNACREGSRGSFEAAADAFLIAHGPQLSPSTYSSYKSCLERLKREYGRFCALEMHTITSRDLQAVVDGLSRSGLAPKSVANYRGFVTSVMTYHSINPPIVRMPQRQRPQLNIPDEVTVRRTLKAAEGTDMELPIMLAAFGPLRRGEICALKREDCAGNVIHVCRSLVKSGDEWIEKPPKTASSDRWLEMPGFVMQKLYATVPDEHGRVVSLNPTEVSKHFARLLKLNDIAPYRFHDLRHFCASDLHAKGIPDLYIQQRTGHSSNEVLRQVYTHTLQDQSAEQTKKIIAHFESIAQ